MISASERNPLKDDFSAVWPEGTPWWRFFPIVERMCKKIEYAKRRWKCSIFYADTNGTYRPVGEEGKFEWMLLEARVWREIRRRHPDVLIIPELAGRKTAIWAQTAPYFELDLGATLSRVLELTVFDLIGGCVVLENKPFAHHDVLECGPELRLEAQELLVDRMGKQSEALPDH